jgi:hypothetical protein
VQELAQAQALVALAQAQAQAQVQAQAQAQAQAQQPARKQASTAAPVRSHAHELPRRGGGEVGARSWLAHHGSACLMSDVLPLTVSHFMINKHAVKRTKPPA